MVDDALYTSCLLYDNDGDVVVVAIAISSGDERKPCDHNYTATLTVFRVYKYWMRSFPGK